MKKIKIHPLLLILIVIGAMVFSGTTVNFLNDSKEVVHIPALPPNTSLSVMTNNYEVSFVINPEMKIEYIYVYKKGENKFRKHSLKYPILITEKRLLRKYDRVGIGGDFESNDQIPIVDINNDIVIFRGQNEKELELKSLFQHD